MFERAQRWHAYLALARPLRYTRPESTGRQWTLSGTGTWRFSVQRTRKGSVVHRDGHETDALGYRTARGDFLHRSRWLRCRRGDQLGFHLQERFFRQELKE